MSKKYYRLDNGKTLEGLSQVITATLAQNHMEYQVYGSANGQWVIQGRAQDHSFLAKLTGQDKAVTVSLTPLGNDSFQAEIGCGKWLDKAASALLSFYVLPPLIFIAGYGAVSQAALPSEIHKAIQNYLNFQEPAISDGSKTATVQA